MFFDPGSIFMLVVLVAVTGYVARSLLLTWHRLSREEKPGSNRLGDIEARLGKVEIATSSLLVDMSGMRDKQRFMARLGEGKGSRQGAPAHSPSAPAPDAGISPLDTQSIPINPRMRTPRSY